MTLDERYDRVRKSVYRFRHWIPLVSMATASVALLCSTPFMVYDGIVFGAVCMACSCIGFAIRWQALSQAAYRRKRVKSDPEAFPEPFPVEGIYSRMRYPLHAGGFLVWLGPILFTGVGWFMVAASLLYAGCVWLTMSREEELRIEKYGDRYRAWCADTPAVIPHFGKSGQPACGRSWIAAWRGDVGVFWSTAVAFVWLGVLKFRMIDLCWDVPRGWSVAGGIALFAWICSRLSRARR